MSFNKIAAVAAAAFIALAAPASAQSAGQMTAARQLVDVSGAVKPFEEFPVAILTQAAQRIAYTNQDPKFRTALNEVVEQLKPEFAARKAEMIEEAAAIYASKFSEAELKEIITFYATPTGKKLIAELPGIAQLTVTKIQAIGGKVSGDVTERLRAEMKKRGFSF